MTAHGRGRVRLLAAGLVGFLFILGASALLRPEKAAAPAPARAARVDAGVSNSAPPASSVVHVTRAPQPGVRSDYIVQASSAALAKRAVEEVGGVVTGDLDIIRAVGAKLDARELDALSRKPIPRLHIFQEGTVQSSSVTPAPETYYPAEVAASTLHQGGVTGRGVTVAVLDTGVWSNKGPLQATSYGRSPRVLAQYDVILDRENPLFYPTRLFNRYGADIDDRHRHGTHVSSIIASSAIAQTNRYQSVAPSVNLVSVRVL